MKIKKLIAFILIIGCLLMISSCNKNKYKAYSITYFDYFDTVTTIIGYEKTEDAFNENASYIAQLLREYHNLYDIYYSYEGMNNLNTINENAGIKKVAVDDKIIDLLTYSLQMYDKTLGMMNIAMGSVLKLWHDERELALVNPLFAKLPLKEDLVEASKHTNIEDIVIDEDEKTVFLKDKDMRLDVGAIAKGYATEEIAQDLESKGITSYTLNVGGNIRLIGSKANGDLWNVGIQNPNLSDDNIVLLSLKDFAVVTSGSYQRYYEVDGVRYHHIIHPNTLMPENKYLSISVIAKSSKIADALSTALFNMNLEEGKNLVDSFNDVYVMWIDSNHKRYYSKGFIDFIIK